jgi:hypothetical protein
MLAPEVINKKHFSNKELVDEITGLKEELKESPSPLYQTSIVLKY